MSHKILSVGEGMGFVVAGRFERFVITAAHCLPFLPPAMSAADDLERIYPQLLARYGETPNVAAYCSFVDPVADIAILSAPDDQGNADMHDAFAALANTITPLVVSAAPEKGPGSLISLNREPVPCVISHMGGPLWLENVSILGGMSGGPIMLPDGSAVGVVVAGSDAEDQSAGYEGPQPALTKHLPGWFLHDECAVKAVLTR